MAQAIFSCVRRERNVEKVIPPAVLNPLSQLDMGCVRAAGLQAKYGTPKDVQLSQHTQEEEYSGVV
jgi:hypothetical protein